MSNLEQPLILHVAGRNRSEDLGKELIEAALDRPDYGLSQRIANEKNVLALSEAGGMSDYLERHVSLLRNARNWVDIASFHIPCRHSVVGRFIYIVRKLMWKVLRYQHRWTSFQQNSINVQLTYQLEFEKDARERQVADLEERLRKVETAVSEQSGEKGKDRTCCPGE